MRWLLACLALTTLASTPLPASASAPAIVSSEGTTSRTLIGDWESPDMVVLVYGDGWLTTHLALLDTLSAMLPVVLLSEPGDIDAAHATVDALRPEQRARVWLPDYEADTSWVRDYGPLQTRRDDGGVSWLDPLYAVERPRDDELPAALATWFGSTVEPVHQTLDGGALASNGRGLCVSTVEYFAGEDIPLGGGEGSSLLDQLGCQTMALVPALAYEDTKHADLLLQFLAPDLAVVARFDPSTDAEDAWRTDTAAEVLERAADQQGQPLTIVRIDSPGVVDGRYRSYVNFLRVADHLLVPGYDSVDPALDDAALATLGRLAPKDTVVRIPADDSSDSGGAVHCLTWGLFMP